MKTKKFLGISVILLVLLLAFPGVPVYGEESTEPGTPFYSEYSGKPDTSWFTESFEGYDADTATFTLTSADQFMGLSAICTAENEFLSDYTVRLAADIRLNKGNVQDWINGDAPANTYLPITEFRGVFDGDGHVISGIYYYNGNAANFGMFCTLNGATVKNVAVVNSLIVGSQQLGIICGRIKGEASTVSNVYSDATIYGLKHHVGGLIGCLETGDGNHIGQTVIESCAFAGEVVAFEGQYAGGMISNTNGHEVTVRNCINLGSISATTQRVGGIIGTSWCTDTTVTTVLEYCINAGPVSSAKSIGAITGYHKQNPLTISNYVMVSDFATTEVGEILGNITPNLTGGETKTAEQIKGTAVFDHWVAVENGYPMPSVTVASMIEKVQLLATVSTPDPDEEDSSSSDSAEDSEETENPGNASQQTTAETDEVTSPVQNVGSPSDTGIETEPKQTGGCASSVTVGFPTLLTLATMVVFVKKARKER